MDDDEREFDADSGFETTVDVGEHGSGASDAAAGDDSARRMRRALAEVRREGRKVAALHALLDAALVALAINLALRLFRPTALPGSLPVPSALVGAGGVVPPSVHGAAVVGLALGVAAFAAEYLGRTRRPLVEQFEAANPAVTEALRTARDSVTDGANTEMARRLYEDVIDRLRDTSSLELVGTRRVVLTTLLVVLVSVASIHVAVVDLDLTEQLDGDDADGPTDPSTGPDEPDDDDDEGLQDGDQILGDPENVSAGEETINASVDGTGEGDGDGGSAAPPSSYDDGGFSDAAVESQEAGYSPSENVEDADLIREYNLQIRERDSDTEDDEDT